MTPTTSHTLDEPDEELLRQLPPPLRAYVEGLRQENERQRRMTEKIQTYHLKLMEQAGQREMDLEDRLSEKEAEVKRLHSEVSQWQMRALVAESEKQALQTAIERPTTQINIGTNHGPLTGDVKEQQLIMNQPSTKLIE